MESVPREHACVPLKPRNAAPLMLVHNFGPSVKVFQLDAYDVLRAGVLHPRLEWGQRPCFDREVRCTSRKATCAPKAIIKSAKGCLGARCRVERHEYVFECCMSNPEGCRSLGLSLLQFSRPKVWMSSWSARWKVICKSKVRVGKVSDLSCEVAQACMDKFPMGRTLERVRTCRVGLAS